MRPTPGPTAFAHGAAMLVRKETIDKVGLMPECYFLYYEEMDWSMMIGSLFAQCIESAGEKTNKTLISQIPLRFPIERYKDFEIDVEGNWTAYYTREYIIKSIEPCQFGSSIEKYNEQVTSFKKKQFIGPIDVKFFGMASSDGQKSISGKKTKTAEGITKYLPVKFTLKGWVDNMISYLRSAMSYTDCHNLNEFIGKPSLIPNSISEIQAVTK